MEGNNSQTSRIKALCVDDDKTAHEILSLFLVDRFTIDYAANGKTALELASSMQYSMIFLDINLGRDVMDGLELLRLIRNLPGYSEVTVIALTAYAMIGDKEEFLAAGCDHYLAKPFNRAGLMHLMSSIEIKK